MAEVIEDLEAGQGVQHVHQLSRVGAGPEAPDKHPQAVPPTLVAGTEDGLEFGVGTRQCSQAAEDEPVAGPEADEGGHEARQCLARIGGLEREGQVADPARLSQPVKERLEQASYGLELVIDGQAGDAGRLTNGLEREVLDTGGGRQQVAGSGQDAQAGLIGGLAAGGRGAVGAWAHGPPRRSIPA